VCIADSGNPTDRPVACLPRGGRAEARDRRSHAINVPRQHRARSPRRRTAERHTRHREGLVVMRIRYDDGPIGEGSPLARAARPRMPPGRDAGDGAGHRPWRCWGLGLITWNEGHDGPARRFASEIAAVGVHGALCPGPVDSAGRALLPAPLITACEGLPSFCSVSRSRSSP